MGLVDWETHRKPIYAVIGEEATLVLADTGATSIELTALDNTVGVAIGDNVDVQTVEPAAVINVSDLAGADPDVVLEGAQLTLNGKTWRVVSFLRRPSPSGEADGELFLILSDAL